MTVYAPIPSQGTLLQVAISSTLTTCSKRTKVGGPPRKRNEVDTTDLDSTWETSIAGIARTGELPLEINLNPSDTVHAYLENSFDSGTIETWALVLSSGATYSFSGWIMELNIPDNETDKVVKGDIKIRVTGPITRTP